MAMVALMIEAGMPNELHPVDVWPRKFTKIIWIVVNVAICLAFGVTFGAVPIYLAYEGSWNVAVVLPFYLLGLIGAALFLRAVTGFIPGLIFTIRSAGPSFTLSDHGLAFCHLPGRPTLAWEAIQSAEIMGTEIKVIAISIRSNSDFHCTFTQAAKVFLTSTSWSWQFHGWLYSRLLFRTTRTEEPEFSEISLSALLRSDDTELGYAVTICWFDIDRSLSVFTRLLQDFISAYNDTGNTRAFQGV